MNPLKLLCAAILWINDFIFLPNCILAYGWYRWLYVQGDHVPTHLAAQPMVEAAYRVELLAKETGLYVPYLHLARAVAELKNTWRKV